MHLGCRIHRIGRRQRRLPAVFNVARKLPEVTLAMTLLFAVLSMGALYFRRANDRRKALTAA